MTRSALSLTVDTQALAEVVAAQLPAAAPLGVVPAAGGERPAPDALAVVASCAGSPGATFVLLDSRNHVLLEHEPAWQAFQQAVLEFTGQPSAADDDSAAQGLTPRERMALRLLCEGQSNAQIAWQLGVAEKTVRNHISNLYRKLGVRSRAEAIVRTSRR